MRLKNVSKEPALGLPLIGAINYIGCISFRVPPLIHLLGTIAFLLKNRWTTRRISHTAIKGLAYGQKRRQECQQTQHHGLIFIMYLKIEMYQK
jgi:hypothetical protein